MAYIAHVPVSQFKSMLPQYDLDNMPRALEIHGTHNRRYWHWRADPMCRATWTFATGGTADEARAHAKLGTQNGGHFLASGGWRGGDATHIIESLLKTLDVIHSEDTNPWPEGHISLGASRREERPIANSNHTHEEKINANTSAIELGHLAPNGHGRGWGVFSVQNIFRR